MPLVTRSRWLVLLGLAVLLGCDRPKSAPRPEAATSIEIDSLSGSGSGDETDSTDVALALAAVRALPPRAGLRSVRAPMPPRDTSYVRVAVTTGIDSVQRTPDSLRIRYWRSIDSLKYRTVTVVDSAEWIVTGGGGTPVTMGVPYGPSQLLSRSASYPIAFTVSVEAAKPDFYEEKVEEAIARKLIGLEFSLTGANHNISAGCNGPLFHCPGGVLQFSMAKWMDLADSWPPEDDARLDSLGQEGFLLANNVMDEPHVSGGGDGNTWGPKGTMTKARVDTLCTKSKQLWPHVPAGVSHPWHNFEATKDYAVCEFTINQYSMRYGSLDKWIEGAQLVAQRQGTAIAYSLNVINGGARDTDSDWDCRHQGGIKGQSAPNCSMTAQQVESFSYRMLREKPCFLMYWRYDEKRPSFQRDDFKKALKNVADSAAKTPRTSCDGRN